ncbi:50S ribosomal L3 [Gossypium australe]|uniref:50S ribosomal L3 n=1 Tax=Gossypium australe TaxID=47621 RepID=A0A5B6X086_9ROSI|nr:50S ribosomal L3 [Gossypium australe]
MTPHFVKEGSWFLDHQVLQPLKSSCLMLNEQMKLKSDEIMEVERKHSKGGFFHLFDWNEESKRVKPVENILKSPPYMMEGDEYNAASSYRRSADFSSASSVASDEGYGSRAPGVVARLMGLDSLPAPNVLEPSSTTYSGSCSHRVSHYERSSPNLWNESQPMDYTDFSNRLDSLSSNPIEPRFHKVQNRPIERFQTEILPLKSAKPIPITQHKLLSPIKSPGFIPTKNAAYIMEAASKIIEVSPQKTSKHKVPSFGLSSVPSQIWDLKDKIEAAHKVSGHQRPDEPIRSTEMSLKGQHKSKSHNKSDYASTFSISRDSEKGSSNNSRNKGKSVWLAEQARVNNVQRKEGSFSSGNGSSANLKEGNDAKRKQFCRSQADRRKSMENGTSANRTNKVLRQNNQKQNCISNRDYSISKTSTLDQQGRKTRSINGTVGLNRTINKVIVNSESQSRKTSSSATDPSKERSRSRRKNLPRKKQPVNEDVLSGETISENTSTKSTQRSIKCNVTIGEHSNQSAEKMKTSMDVVSFTFTSPIARSVPDVPSTSQVVETSCSFDNDPCGNNDLLFSKSSGFSSLGLNIIGGDDLSVLLGKKLQELAYRVESSNCNIIMEETSSCPASSWQNSVLPSGTLITTSMRHHKGLQLDLDKDISYGTADFNCSSIDHLELDWRRKWQFSEEIEDRNASKSSSKTGTELDHQQPSPLSTLELAVTSECFADDRDGMKQELLARNQELLGSQPGSESETEFDVALSDFASPKTVGEMDKKLPTRTPNSRDLKESTNWELDYVKMVLKDSELKLMEYAVGQTENIMTPNGFDQLEHRNITETRGEEYKKLEQKLVVDCVSEYLEFVVGSCKGWGKLMQNKGRLAEEVYKEIMSLKQMGDIMEDEVVDKDMSRKHGRWVQFETEAFEEGLEIEKTILTCLVDELVFDLLL